MDLIDILSTTAAVFIVTLILLLIIAFHTWLKKKLPAVYRNSCLGGIQNQVVEETQKQLLLLNHISEQILEDTRLTAEALISDRMAVEVYFTERLGPTQSSVGGAPLFESLLNKFSEQDQQADEIWNTLQTLESGFSSLKNELQLVSPSLTELVRTEVRRFASTAPTQTETVDGINNELYDESSTSESVATILQAAAKESLSKLAADSEERRRKMIHSITRSLEQSQKDIMKELIIFSSVAERHEPRDRMDDSISVAGEVDRIEKNLLETLIFLNSQRFDMENLMGILTYFTKKFLRVTAKFEAYWQNSEAVYSNSAQRLKEIEVLLSSVTEKVSENSRELLQQSDILTSTVADINSTLNNASFPDTSFKKFDSCGLSDESDLEWIQNVERANQALQDLSVVNEGCAEKLNCLIEATRNLENFRSLILNMTEGYSTLLSCLPLSREGSPRTVNNHLTTQPTIDGTSENRNTIYDCSKEERRAVGIDAICEMKNNESHGVCQELEPSFKSYDIDFDLFNPRDLVKTVWELLHPRKVVPEHSSETDSTKSKLPADPDGKDQCEDIRSDSLFNDVSSDWLTENSDE